MKSFFDKFEERLLISGMAAIVIIVFLQVIMRYFFQKSLTWSEEIARFTFLWMVWLGAGYATKKRAHIKIEAFVSKLSSPLREKINFTALIIWVLFAFFLVFKGGQLTYLLFKRHQLSPVLEIPMAWAYMAVPAGSGLMLLRLLRQLPEALKDLRARKEVKELI